ncbi:TetR/AcrR family transcriptional regulator [Goodfellowiella coeruleoviolacea]|uniref:Transcriptional regulator, TetR family n=1 Tax=Goodfellowiella coeruleoviolacea TaxID=334858 RepID=A0AAE3GDW2_9PSEU|nr:TetR/AcrR family transcriptional regulator [Goodfellowiella coeruleoviolacea]MCP2165492.1 transcriptional regulator, TetR family [Goodfellowiella coeruleoviolacea]
MTGPARSRRQRYRDQTREEAKQLAMTQLAELGPTGVSVNAIAKRMGLTGPALYRYFASRDDLLTELIRDAYRDLAESLEAAGRASQRRQPAARVRAVTAAFREWALAAPHRYLLLFGTPVPGYAAPPDTVEAANRSMVAILDAFSALPTPPAPAEAGPAEATDRADAADPLDRQLADLARRRDLAVTPEQFRRGLLAWTRLHGVLSLEVQNQFAPMGVDPALVYRAEVETLIAGG